ncbi:GNAT family N-acetyltransferase [Tenacibaculum caenipelagi]|uniref:Acetyltransferase (GNAT) family protein n=1 Tax=Tenacibaculum caenipelagi TaxID=1325435 RepID=A0A4R6TDH4_9FLAO|nr:GNAT family N-acetyltransferase [Tenacibaculum caenipelagi]TDQ27518.1 acetyltransferase (GNAT) family protein [Tenacibaculum caenipelagi]
MKIENSNLKDVDKIFELYKNATDFQKTKSVVPWPEFDSKLIKKEVIEKRQWKIIINNEVACVWATTESDPEIWQERNDDPAIYIHRISTNPNFRGRNLVEEIVKWSKDYAAKKNKKYVRMDTVGENIGLIKHYKKCGFEFLGLSKLEDTDKLPAHYHNATVSLFQLSV